VSSVEYQDAGITVAAKRSTLRVHKLRELCGERASTSACIARWAVQLRQAGQVAPVLVFLLDSKLALRAVHSVEHPQIGAGVLRTRDVFQAAIVFSAERVVLAQFVPMSKGAPREEDVAASRTILAAGDVLGIPVLDHLAIGPDGLYFSFAAKERLTMDTLG
jgi:DNA repair protein RadC